MTMQPGKQSDKKIGKKHVGRRISYGRPLGLIGIFAILWIVIIARLVQLQIFEYEKYQGKVTSNVQKESTVDANRGEILDSTGVALATNITTWRVFVSPADVEDKEQETLIAQKLSETLDVDIDEIYEKLAKTERKDETIAKNVDEQTYQQLAEFVEENDLTRQICFEQSYKRYYPYGSLASNVIGITGTDGGLFGLEYQYDDELTGVEGKYITARSGSGNSMPYKYNSYVDAENGGNLVTTINSNIQSILEEQLKATYEDNHPLSRVCGIVMDPDDGSILAMGVYPTVDLNNPYELDEDSLEVLAESGYDEDSEEYNKLYWEQVYALWKNKAVSELYEPGSTFKVITTAMALEEGTSSFSDTFYCGYDNFYVTGYDSPIKCHKEGGHGTVTFAVGLQQSCNVTLMNVAFKLGAEKFYDYFQRFGYTETTGIDLPGEESPIYSSWSDFGPVSLAVYSFGQTFKVTPVQQIRALCAVANGGYLVTPHVVDKIVDDDGNILYQFADSSVRQVVSSDVCSEISAVLEEGVSGDGGAKNTYVAGYKIAAKTGTSQIRDKLDKYGNSEYVVGSTIAYAPYDDAQVAVLIMCDSPTNSNQYGSVVAAPYVAKVLEGILPILGVEKSYTEEDSSLLTALVSDYSGKTVDTAKQQIESKGLNCVVYGDGDTVDTQSPSRGSSVSANDGTVYLFTGGEEKDDYLVTVPDLVGNGAADAISVLNSRHLNYTVNGSATNSAKVLTQSAEAGTEVPRGTVITISARSLSGTE